MKNSRWWNRKAPEVQTVEPVIETRSHEEQQIVIPRRDTATRVVTADKAMAIIALFRGMSLIATSVSQCELEVRRINGRVVKGSTDRTRLVRNPTNDEDDARAFIEATTNSLTLSGNAYWRLIRTGPEMPVLSIELLNPNFMEVEKNNGRVEYRYQDKVYKAWQIRHLKLNRIPGRLTGLGPVEAAKTELGGMLDLSEYASDWFNSSGVPTLMVVPAVEPSPGAIKRFLEHWHEMIGSKSRIGVAPKGAQIVPVNVSPKDAQFLESRQHATTEIARLLGIPAHYLLALVQGNSSVTYTNLLDTDTEFVKHTLMNYFSEIERAMTAVINTIPHTERQQAKFNLAEFLRSDEKRRYETYEIGIRAGFITTDEVREKEGLPKINKEDALNSEQD